VRAESAEEKKSLSDPVVLPPGKALPVEAASAPSWTHIETPAEPPAKEARAVLRTTSPTPVEEIPLAPAHLTPQVLEQKTEQFRAASSAPFSPTQVAKRDVAVDEPVETPSVDATLMARETAIRDESSKFAARAREAALRRKEYEATQNQTRSTGSTYFVYGTLSIIALSLLVIIASAGYALLERQSPLVDAPEPGLSMLFAVSESVAVPLTNDRVNLMIDLTKRVAEARGTLGSFVRFYFYYPSDITEAELPTQAFIDALDLRAPGSMLRTILSSSMFGVYLDTSNAPFLVLKVRNFEDALGGMLLFEKNMNSDLAPIFGENLDRIGGQGIFRDEVVGGTDARSLYDVHGNMLMTYAFIDRETIVITTSYTALGALAQVLK
jgi:hypothetical protein